MFVLTNPVQAYAWGAEDGLARLAGTPPTGGPEAELWIGAHPAAPSTTAAGRPLHEVVAEDPAAVLGPEAVARLGPELPYLMKVLAIGSPLSIQLHPSAAQAEAGFAREEAAGVARDDPRRTYRDPLAKPEVLVALTPTWVMAGFRGGADAAAALARLATDHRSVAALRDRVADQPDARAALVHLLAASQEERTELALAAASADPAVDDAHRWVSVLADRYPGDPTALAPLLLDLRRLEEGEGVFLPAGVPHMYLEGAGIELMGASDNVVRGGLTPKHVDRDELVRLLAPPGTGPVLLQGTAGADGVTTYAPEVPQLALHRVGLGRDPVLLAPDPPGPALVLVLGGAGVVEVGAEVAEVQGGRAVLVTAAERRTATISGSGTAWWATVGTASPR